MPSGFKIGEVLADTDVRASRPERLSENRDAPSFSRIDIYAPRAGNGVTGNTEAVWIGLEGTSADPGFEAGTDLHPGDSIRFENTSLYDIFLAFTTDGDKVTWIAYP